MITLYTWGTPNGRKVSIMLEECALPYRVKTIDITQGEQLYPEFVVINPNSKIPAIVDPDGPDGKPITLFESGAILLYLAAKTGRFLPKSDRGKYEALQWLMFQLGGALSFGLRNVLPRLLGTSGDDADALPVGRMRIEGDAELARRLQRLAERFDPDLSLIHI